MSEPCKIFLMPKVFQTTVLCTLAKETVDYIDGKEMLASLGGS